MDHASNAILEYSVALGHMLSLYHSAMQDNAFLAIMFIRLGSEWLALYLRL